MELPSAYQFEAYLPGLAVPVRIASLYDAQIFTRRWVIRVKDRELRALLRKMEKANSSESGYVAMRDFKQALMARGLLANTMS